MATADAYHRGMFGFVLRGLTPLTSSPRRWAVALWCGFNFGLVAAAPALPAHRLTVLEGEAVVIDGARALAAAPGLVLKPGAIVESHAQARLVRIEFADGGVADLGPGTKVMVAPRGFPSRQQKPPALYLLSGWVKQASGAGAPAAGLVTPALDLLPFSGTVVVQVLPQAVRVFVEGGRAELLERRRGGTRVALASGEMYAAEAASAGQVTPRPGADFITALPRLFRDRIPSQAGRFQDAVVEAAPLPAPSYAGLRDWLVAEPLVRRDFPRRFGVLARQGPFRSALEGGLAQHPEWTPVLYPPAPPPMSP
ncbi:MAG: hypothetical protein Q7S90_08845 [Rubrivivax sp.]|nr:hypothetical protein [Rubrivivax sp.]